MCHTRQRALMVFFFQAEDGIRDSSVTGVQTCALPICVAGGVQYTIPVDEAVQRVRSGVRPELSARERHRRECFVVLEQGANADGVRQAITGMPHYFDEYDTTVHFISAEELARDHAPIPHDSFFTPTGRTPHGP